MALILLIGHYESCWAYRNLTATISTSVLLRIFGNSTNFWWHLISRSAHFVHPFGVTLNQVPASAGVRVEMSVCLVAGNTVWSHIMWVPVAVRLVVNLQAAVLHLLTYLCWKSILLNKCQQRRYELLEERTAMYVGGLFALGASSSPDTARHYMSLASDIAHTCHESYDRAGLTAASLLLNVFSYWHIVVV